MAITYILCANPGVIAVITVMLEFPGPHFRFLKGIAGSFRDLLVAVFGNAMNNFAELDRSNNPTGL